MKFVKIILFVVLTVNIIFAQDKAEYQKKFIWDKEKDILTGDFSKIKRPQLKDFKTQAFHFEPIRQDTAGTCWAFSTTSFFESEIYRLHSKKIKLSESYTVYWEYIEKARRFVKEKGDSKFAQGSEANAVLERIKQYGCVPQEVYTGLINGLKKHNHDSLYDEMDDYLQFIEENNYWDEKIVLNNLKQILNKYLGEPPAGFDYQGKSYTPVSFRDEVCQLNMDDYVDFMSTLKTPFYTTGEFEVEDNWWHSDVYHNIPLDVFYKAIKNAIKNGYSLETGGDVSEPGRNRWEDIAIIVPWDLAQKDINQYSRELRIYNKTTEDDHGIHLVGYTKKDGRDWFLIKDSGSSAHYGEYKGYFFFRDDYVKLKILTFMVHKDAVKDILKKFD
ncbi:MAG: C1 family peptidase [Calditrichales bacterium]|nr:C1 family peptidase [Calditrichales bacterium]